MERLGGGGHMSSAGCQMDDIPVEEAVDAVKDVIDKMIEEGELS